MELEIRRFYLMARTISSLDGFDSSWEAGGGRLAGNDRNNGYVKIHHSDILYFNDEMKGKE